MLCLSLPRTCPVNGDPITRASPSRTSLLASPRDTRIYISTFPHLREKSRGIRFSRLSDIRRGGETVDFGEFAPFLRYVAFLGRSRKSTCLTVIPAGWDTVRRGGNGEEGRDVGVG